MLTANPGEAQVKMGKEAAPEVRKRDREATERRLIDAALGIFDDNGILGGLNLRDVANRAGVARGNIYNYFGDRRQLLRRAMSLRIGESDDARGVSALPFVKRKMRIIGGDSQHLEANVLLSMLVIDGDDEVQPMPFFDDAMERMRDSLEDGDIHPDYAHDLESLHITINAASRGYNLLRTAYARQLDISPAELDERVRPIFEDWLAQIAQPRLRHDESEQP